MKKIAYIELDTHAEIAANFSALAHGLKEISVDYFFSKKIFSRIQNPPANSKITSPEEILSVLVGKHYDAVIVGTAHRHFGVYQAICERFPTAVIVHNLNFSRAKKWQLLLGVFEKDWRYRIKLLLKEKLLAAPKVYQLAKHRLVLDAEFSSSDYAFLPVFYNEFSNKSLVSEKTVIAVPGVVSQKRRDYAHIFKTVKNFKNPFEIVLLGKASGKELAEIKSLALPKNITLKFFTEKVPGEEFEHEMLRADVLWCPLQQGIKFLGVQEFYGKTKMSGNVGDALKYGRPAIFPTHYAENYPFIFSENPDVEAQLLQIKNSWNFDFQKEFSKEKVRKKFLEVLMKI